jgi:branched-chain amino acid transport system permease protein
MFSLAMFGQALVNGVSLSAIYVLIALGFTLLFGIMRVVNFAHGAFAMFGGYALFFAYGQYQLPYAVAIIGSALLVASAGLIFEYLVVRWFYHKMFQSMIGLMGLNMAMVFTGVIVWDAHERSIPAAASEVLFVGDLVIPADRVVVLGVAIVVLFLFWMFISKTKYGLAMRAASQDVEIAGTQGINARRVYQVAFFIAIFMTALAGSLYSQVYALSPFVGERILMVAFVVVILGGMGSIPGAALGGILLGLSESFLSTFFGSAVSTFVTFGAVILLLVVRPWGILGEPE